MTADARTRMTEWAAGAATGEGFAEPVPEELLPLVYDELRRLAGAFMARERRRGTARDHTLDATGLVHEAYLRLVDQSRVDWRGRSHFLAVGAEAMRRLLIDHARGRRRAKRGGDWRRVSFAHEVLPEGSGELEPQDVLAIHRALERLAELDPRQARIVELRFFGGLSVREVAAVLDLSQRTVEGDWTHARAWLRRALAGGEST